MNKSEFLQKVKKIIKERTDTELAIEEHEEQINTLAQEICILEEKLDFFHKNLWELYDELHDALQSEEITLEDYQIVNSILFGIGGI